MPYLIFDLEMTGSESDYHDIIQIGAVLADEQWNKVSEFESLVYPDNPETISKYSEEIHGISTALADQFGEPIEQVLAEFNEALGKAKFVVGQNVGFDINVTGCEFYRYGVETPMVEMPVLDTCTETTANLCKIPGGRGGRFKLPTLTELHSHLFGEAFKEAHNATADVEATTRCFLELVRRGVFPPAELPQTDR